MGIEPFSALAELASTAIDKIFPDATQREIEKRKLEKIKAMHDYSMLQSQFEIMLAQIDVNKAEAQHKSLFVAGARPAAIWVGVAAMGWTGIIHPALCWVWAFCNMAGNPPDLIDPSALTALVGGLLGIGAMRSYDKKNGTETNHLNPPKS